MRARVLVLGGGIAGIAAALRLADAGCKVTLIESRERLGGRASSFLDARTGLLLDNCQHVTLGCCVEYLSLCDELGVRDWIRWDSEQYWVEPGGRETVLAPTQWLPGPMQGLPAFTAARFLSWSEKARVAMGLAHLAVADRRALGATTFRAALDEWGQEEPERTKFWDPIIISACNMLPERVSARPAVQVFQDAFLKGAAASAIGIMTRPLVRVYDAAESLLRNRGGLIHLGESVASFDASSATLASGETLVADRVVCALPFEKARAVVAPSIRFRDDRFASLEPMGHSPILGVHLFFDRPVLERPHAVLVGRPTQWLFRKDESGATVHAVISAADDWVDLSPEQIAARVLADLHACFPRSASASLVSCRPVKERRATFAYVPGFDDARPGPAAEDGAGPFLAGDYTRTDWPATMEGATISGRQAASALLDTL